MYYWDEKSENATYTGEELLCSSRLFGGNEKVGGANPSFAPGSTNPRYITAETPQIPRFVMKNIHLVEPETLFLQNRPILAIYLWGGLKRWRTI